MSRKLLIIPLLGVVVACTEATEIVPTETSDAALTETPVSAPQRRTVSFGNDRGEYPRDGECDDPRFVGAGMASTVEDANIRGDAEDCRRHFRLGNIRLARLKSESSISECRAINYGNNASEWARDGECDDPRFTGPGTDDIMQINDLRSDARDCRALCEAGQVWLK